MQNRKPIPVYAVIGDGTTEQIYVESIKEAFREKLTHCTLKPDLPLAKSVGELEKLIEECKNKGYDKVLCIIDMDTKLRNRKEMMEYQKLKGKAASNVYFFETHPCTELWFYYHFKYTTKPLSTFDPDVKKLIQSKIPGYEKKAPFCRHPHICKCKGTLDNAVKHGRLSMKTKLFDSRDYSYSDMAKFFEEIGLFATQA